MHELPESIGSIDYLFQSAPKEIETYGYGTTKRWELTDGEENEVDENE